MGVIVNEVHGGEEDKKFAIRYGAIPVRAISVWVEQGSEWPERNIVKALRVTWVDGRQHTVGKTTGVRSDFVFDDDEKVTVMSLWTGGPGRGGRVDQIWISAGQNHTFQCGGGYGYQHKQMLGNGTLLGFENDD
ncbi:hypothetical protein GGR58DRAFT_521957 [Xylaria digitata]|nr:hypothetical protein GGR58DRAFT_521957 [Xylaria digitata]